MSFAGKQALIIEDDTLSVKVLKTLLEQLGVEVSVIYDSIEAAETLQYIQKPDVIFLDLEMPRSDGYAVLAVIRAIDSLKGVPIIAYTTHISHMTSTRQAGFDGFLGKPLEHDKFPEQLARIFEGEGVWEIPG